MNNVMLPRNIFKCSKHKNNIAKYILNWVYAENSGYIIFFGAKNITYAWKVQQERSKLIYICIYIL